MTTSRTDLFTSALMNDKLVAINSLTRTMHRDGMHEVVDVNVKTLGTFPTESRSDYRYMRETAFIWGAEKVRGYKDSFGRYERIVITFPLGN